MEAARMMKANMKLDGRPCGWCQAALRLGDDAAICNACEREHHGGCWEQQAGCSTAGCLSAPLRRLDAAPAAAPSPYAYPSAFGSPFPQGPAAPSGAASSLPPGFMHCPVCRAQIIAGTPICPSCRSITSPDGLYHGPKTNAPGAVSSMVLGIIGMFLCGFILGPIAIVQANGARRSIASDPTLGGGGMATAGLVLGIIALVFNVIGFLILLGGRH